MESCNSYPIPQFISSSISTSLHSAGSQKHHAIPVYWTYTLKNIFWPTESFTLNLDPQVLSTTLKTKLMGQYKLDYIFSWSRWICSAVSRSRYIFIETTYIRLLLNHLIAIWVYHFRAKLYITKIWGFFLENASILYFKLIVISVLSLGWR